jgi:hypothetical protein
MGRTLRGADTSRTFEASSKLVVPDVPDETGSCVSPIGTTAEMDDDDVIETHGRCANWLGQTKMLGIEIFVRLDFTILMFNYKNAWFFKYSGQLGSQKVSRQDQTVRCLTSPATEGL